MFFQYLLISCLIPYNSLIQTKCLISLPFLEEHMNLSKFCWSVVYNPHTCRVFRPSFYKELHSRPGRMLWSNNATCCKLFYVCPYFIYHGWWNSPMSLFERYFICEINLMLHKCTMTNICFTSRNHIFMFCQDIFNFFNFILRQSISLYF